MTLDDAKTQAERFGRQLHGLNLLGDTRSRVALACFAVAQQHHSAMLILLDRPNPLQSTAFALLRPLMEATFRGEWVLHCAKDDQVRNFATGGKQQLDMASVIKALEKLNPGSDAHRILYLNNWKIVSAYTHCFEHQVQHWLVQNDVSPKYESAQVAWLLNAGTACFRLCVSSVQSLVAR
jgi:hypothetical protein